MGIYFGQDFKSKVIEGMRKGYEALIPSYGPTNWNVLIDKDGKQYPTKDGNTILESLVWKDSLEDTGLKLLQIAAHNTMSSTGDGTTVTTILTYNLIKELNKLDTAGCNVNHLLSGIKKAKEDYFEIIEQEALPAQSEKDLFNIVYNSCREEKLTKVILEAASYTGDDGIITVEEGKDIKDKVIFTDGYIYDKGMLNSKFMNKSENYSWEAENVRILLYTGSILVGDVPKMLPIVGQCQNNNIPLLIIAGDLGRNAIQLLIVNNNERGLVSCATQVPEWGEVSELYNKDISVYTGARIINPEFDDLSKVTIDDLGYAKKVSVNRESTVLYEGGGNPDLIEEHISLLKKQKENSKDPDMIVRLTDRIAKLSGGITTIFLGGYTEKEMIERKMRAEDAVSAMQSATRYGIIPSIAMFMYEASNKMNTELESDYLIGYNTFKKVLQIPIELLFKNNDMYHREWLPKLKQGKGYDFNKGKIVDMRKSGLIDSAQVAYESVKNAMSIAETILLGNVGITAKGK